MSQNASQLRQDKLRPQRNDRCVALTDTKQPQRPCSDLDKYPATEVFARNALHSTLKKTNFKQLVDSDRAKIESKVT
jgi:hypothetical protein